MTPPNSSTSSRQRSLAAWVGLASWRGRLAWLAGSAVLVVLVCWVLARRTPAWYLPLDPADDGVQRAALTAQTRATMDLHNALERLPLGEQRWSITQEEVNALLAVKTDLRRGPITDPFVVFSRRQITLCARVKQLPGPGAQGGVGSLTFAVGMTNDATGGGAMGLVKLTQVRVGDLPVPRSLVEARLRAQVPGMIQAVHQALEMQVGTRDADKVGPILEQIIRSAGDEQPFPLHYQGGSRELIIRELRVDDGVFSMVLAPVKSAATRAALAP